MADPNAILMALARQQAKEFNSSPFSQSVSKDVKEAASAVAQALMAPRNALNGQYNYVEVQPNGYVNPFNTGLMSAANNMAGVVSLGSAPVPRPKGSIGAGGVDIFSNKSASFEELMAATRQRISARDSAVNDILNSGRQSVRMKGRAGMVLVGPDMSVPGKYRVTYFDPQGVPNGHVELPAYVEALQRAIQDGFSE